MRIDFNKLTEKFPSSQIEFRIGALNKEKTKGIVLAYVTNRAIQNRLDEVCGPENWKNVFLPWKDGSQLCGLSIRISEEEWITKWDGAEDTKTEPIKGGLSASMKRAAAQWGIGRYLYDVPSEWAEIVAVGNSYKFKNKPKLPKEFLPVGDSGRGGLADVATETEKTLLDKSDEKKRKISTDEANKLCEIILRKNISPEKVKKWGKVKALEELTVEQFDTLIGIYEEQGIIEKKSVASTMTENDKKGLERLNGVIGK